MHDRGIIYCGLLIFVGAFTFPVWHGLAAHTTTKGPQQALPANAKECVEPVDFMKSSHMQFLVDERDRVVRNGDRTLLAFNHKTYNLNLTSTCLTECHSGKADFCDRCHAYAGVAPSCWNCHLDSKKTSVAQTLVSAGSRLVSISSRLDSSRQLNTGQPVSPAQAAGSQPAAGFQPAPQNYPVRSALQ